MHYHHTNTSLQRNLHVSKVHRGSAYEPCASGLPFYCTLHVCVPNIIVGLAVWRHINKKTKVIVFATVT